MNYICIIAKLYSLDISDKTPPLANIFMISFFVYWHTCELQCLIILSCFHWISVTEHPLQPISMITIIYRSPRWHQLLIIYPFIHLFVFLFQNDIFRLHKFNLPHTVYKQYACVIEKIKSSNNRMLALKLIGRPYRHCPSAPAIIPIIH